MKQTIHLNFESRGYGQNVVFSHGTPTYSGEYEKVVQRLESGFRFLLIDHLGFGKSPKPFRADYSIEAHQQRFRASLLENKVKSFHLVVHDFGGVIALPLLVDPDFEVLSLTILNSWYWSLIETEPQMKAQSVFVKVGILPLLYRYLNFSPKILLKMAWGSHCQLTKERHNHYIGMFPTRSERSGAIGFLRALFEFENPVWKKTETLKNIKIPIQIIWGKADKLISVRNLERWKQIFPNAKVVALENVGHFVAEEAPEIFADELDSFLRKNES
jgi:pimeloyl-ACP methyl ester carboxylesterase